MIGRYLDMKGFFEQCLRDLEALAGKPQLRFWELEAAKAEGGAREGQRKIQVCVAGMLEVSKKFPEFSDDQQKEWILRMIVEDAANYDQLNSATVWRWLNMKRQQSAPKITEDQMIQQHEPATDEQIKKHVQTMYEIIAQVGRKVPSLSTEEILKEGQERKPLWDVAKQPGRPLFRINGHVELHATDAEVAKETYKREFPGEEILEIEEIKQP